MSANRLTWSATGAAVIALGLAAPATWWAATPLARGTNEVGTLMLGVYDDEKRLRYAGSVGTGWTSNQAAALLRELAALETTAMPFHPD